MLKFYTDAGTEVKSIDDWRKQLAEPERNWKKGKSAYELAHSWLGSNKEMPLPIQHLLDSSEIFANLTIERAIVEKKVKLDSFGEPSHTDLMLYGRGKKGKVVIAVEGKENEPFDRYISDWLKVKAEGSKKPARLKGLLQKLNLNNLSREEIGRIGYQLLHRTISALNEANEYGAKYAMMLVHSFSDIDTEDHFADYEYFCNLLGIKSGISRNKISGAVIIDDINLYFGWLRDEKSEQIGMAEFRDRNVRPELSAAGLYEKLSKEWPTLSEEIPWKGEYGDWTAWVKSYFHNKGRKLGFKPEHTPLSGGQGEGEYIVDLCWWPEGAEKYWLELVLESEWSGDWKNEIDQDFHKLIDLKARLKVWVCEWGEGQMEKAREHLCRLVVRARFTIPEEEYLIINMPYSKEAGHKECVGVEGFWMNSSGVPNPLPPFQIHRYASCRQQSIGQLL